MPVLLLGGDSVACSWIGDGPFDDVHGDRQRGSQRGIEFKGAGRRLTGPGAKERPDGRGVRDPA
eukprot:10553352-Lingulodinium_polyedra.AAC.1